MTFHHLNRFKAHAQADLAPNERLLAWHFAYETRTKTNYYSESLRRLEDTLELHARTIRRAMSRLVDLGLFERIDRTGTYAPIYRLSVQCPEGCELLSDHYTKQELETLETLGGSNTPTLTSNQTPPYIEIEREDDFSSVSGIETGSAELGYVLKALEKVKTLDTSQLTLKALIELNPRAVAETALEITKKLDSPKRKQAYLEKVVSNTPEALLAGLNEQQATLAGSTRLQGSPKQTAPLKMLEGLEPEQTWERIQTFASQVKSDYVPTYLAKKYLEKKALKGELTDLEINLSSMLEQVIIFKAFPFMKPEVAKPNDGSIYFDLDKDGKLEVFGWLQGWLQDVDFLYTAEELASKKELHDTLAVARVEWAANNPNQEFSINTFSMLESVRTAWATFPEISEDEKTNRFLDHFTNTFREFAKDFRSRNESTSNFRGWLAGNYSLEDDFKTWLQYFPERETGSHAKNYKKAFHAYLTAIRSVTQSDLRIFAGDYWDKLEHDKVAFSFAKLPQNWLGEIVETSSKEAVRSNY